MQDYFLQLVRPRVAPETDTNPTGLPLVGGATAPFVVDRGWVGPAGTYVEEWSIRRGEQVLYRHPPAYIQVRGHQAVRRFSDTVRVPLALEPGAYEITFVIGKYKMGSIEVDAAPLQELLAAAAAAAPPPPPPPAPARTAPASPRPAAAQAAAAPAVPYTGEDPAVIRARVYAEELAKGSDARVAEARAKSAEMKAKKAMAAAGAAPTEAPAPPPSAAAVAPETAEKGPGKTTAAALAAVAPPGGGHMSDEEAAKVRELVYAGAIEEGVGEQVATARADAAEVRARRGVWWRPDWH